MHTNTLQQLVTARHGANTAPASILAHSNTQRPESLTIAAAGDRGDGFAPNADTVFRIASCTKSFTAARALQLRDSGSLQLDARVTELLPTQIVFLNTAGAPIDANAAPTVRMLLTMSAGLPTDDAWADRLEAMPRATFDELLAGGVRLNRTPGTAYEYSNLGWAILGRILEHCDGRALQQQIETELLDPLGLSGVRFTPPPGRILAQGYARRAHGWQPEPVTPPGAFSAIGGLFASCSDLSRWAAWLSSSFDEQGSDDVLSRASRREMQQLHQIVLDPLSPHPRGYGYGLVIEHSPAEGHVVAHSGGYPGFSAHMRWSIDTGDCVIGFENAGYAGVHTVVRTAFSAAIASRTQAANTAAAESRTSARADATPAASPWPETEYARKQLSQLFERPADLELWNTLATELCDTCVAQDLPLPERSAALVDFLSTAGTPLGVEHIEIVSPSHLRWLQRYEHCTLEVTLQLNPLKSPRVQRFDIRALAAPNPLR